MPNMPPSLHWLFRNAGTKLIALSLALVVYVHVYTEQEDERRFHVPLIVSGLGPNLVLAGEPPREVTITARGKRKQLFKMDWNKPHLEMDLAGARPGDVQRMLSPADVSLDPGIEAEVKSVDAPRLVTVEVDTVIAKAVRVTVPLIGDLPRNLLWAHPVRPEPARVEIRGPSRLLAAVDEVSTAPLDLGSVREAGDFRLALRIDASFPAEPVAVEAVVAVVAGVERSFGPVPVSCPMPLGVPEPLVEPDSVMVLLTGPEDLLDRFSGAGLKAWVEGPGSGPDPVRRRPQVRLSTEKIRVTGTVPPEVRVLPRP